MSGPAPVRLLTPDAALLDAALDGDEALAAALGHPVVPGWATFAEALGPSRDALAADPRVATWGARLFLAGEPAELVGWGGFKGPPDGGAVELGYEIAPARRRRGLAAGAVRAMLAEAFADPAVQLVLAHTKPEANVSNHLLERAGFVYEGVGDDGSEIAWRFGLTRADWEVRPAGGPADRAG